MKTSESTENLQWLAPHQLYICRKTLSGLKAAREYRFEAFSGDPLGDTRQYLFTDVMSAKAQAVELTHPAETPLWCEYLEPKSDS